MLLFSCYRGEDATVLLLLRYKLKQSEGDLRTGYDIGGAGQAGGALRPRIVGFKPVTAQ